MKNFLIGLLIVAIIIGTAFGVKWEIDTFNAKYNAPVVEEIKEVEDIIKTKEELNVTDDLVVNLINNLTNITNYSGNDFFGYLYQKDMYELKDLSNQFKLNVAMAYLIDDNDYDYEDVYNNKTTISISQIEEYAKKIFGENVSLNYEDIKGSCEAWWWTYDKTNQLYKNPSTGCGGAFLPQYYKKTTKAIKYDDKIEIIEKVAYSEYTDTDIPIKTIYTSMNKNQELIKLENNEDFNINNYLDKLDSYKYTFKKEGDNYYFYSVELIK